MNNFFSNSLQKCLKENKLNRLRCPIDTPFDVLVLKWHGMIRPPGLSTSEDPPCRGRCTLNLSRAQTSYRWCGVEVRRGRCQFKCRPRHLIMVQNYVHRQMPSNS
ncbi:hypothetical protein TNCV_1592331 [Trichonephila clavipes]|nr:hypothetical protein TNCV_1592331 [Trichonephila clavipes]